jgi:hypothetical protein
MKVFGKKSATAGIALIGIGAITVAPTVQAPPRQVPAVQLAAVTSPTVVQPLAQQSNYLGALFSLDLGGFIIAPSAAQVFPTPPEVPGPSPAPTNFEFEDAIINTYHAIEPWVQYGFEVATYAVGWIPWVGWLAPQIMIFYHWLEPVVASLVENSANWLWGPLPFGEGVRNIANDSWDAFVQFGINQWNFWLPPLPPLPGGAQLAETQLLAAAEALAPPDQLVTSPTPKPHPLQDILVALRRLLPGPDPVAPQNVAAFVDNLRAALNPDVANLPAALNEDIANLRALLRRDVTAGTARIDSPTDTTTSAEETQLASGNDSVTGGAAGTDQSSTESDKSGYRFGRGERFHHVRGLLGSSEAAPGGQQSAKDAVSSTAEEQGNQGDNANAADTETQSKTPARGNMLRAGRHGDANRADDVKKDGEPASGEAGGKTSDQQNASLDKAGASTAKADKSSDTPGGSSNRADNRSHRRDASSGNPRKSAEKPSGPSAKRSADSADNDSGDKADSNG